MEFTDKSASSHDKCMICMNPAWIKIAVIENRERSDKFVCVEHFIEFLNQFISGDLNDSIILFNQESKMLEIPLYEAMERFGGLDEKILLEKYIEYLNEKIKNIDLEISQSTEQFFSSLLQNERQDKILRKLLAQARLKQDCF